MKKNNFKKGYLLIALFPLALLLNYLSYSNPNITEKIYSEGIYNTISQGISKLTGIFPFSLFQFILIGFIVFAIFWISSKVVKIFRFPYKRKENINKSIFNIIIFFSVVYFTFISFWGLNYYRLPFSEISNLKTDKSSINDLIKLSNYLVNESNSLRESVAEDNFGVMSIPKGYRDVFNRAELGYRNASIIYPELKGSYGKPKAVIGSELMSYLGISGIYSPFTFEANINVSIPDSLIPATTSHEMAHQYGFAREDEANFIAYLTCTLHPNKDFKYSGTLLALIHTMNKLYEYDTDKYWEIYDKLNLGTKRDLKDISNYWKRYEGPVEDVSSKVNDTYLKANRQEDGINSYGRMVDLLLAMHKQKIIEGTEY